MTDLVAPGYIPDAARTDGEMKDALENLRSVIAETPGNSAETELTIAAGAVTPTIGTHRIDTQADAATDDLDTINVANTPIGRLLLIRPENNGRVVVARNAQGGTGQILTVDGANFSMSSTKMGLLLKRVGNNWEEVERFFGDRLDLMRTYYGQREKLGAARTYYVRTDGSDANTGLADNAGGAFLTIQKAIDTAAALDNGGFTVTIQVRDGTFTGANALKSFLGSGKIIIQGNAGTPANCLISTTSADCFSGVNVVGIYQIKDLKVQTTTSGFGIDANGGTTRIEWTNVVFGACANAHITALFGATAAAVGNYSITGAATQHLSATDSGIILVEGRTITTTGTIAYSVANWLAVRTGVIRGSTVTFTGGTITGTRYSVTTNAVIETSGGGANYVPGNVAGTSATGGQYV